MSVTILSWLINLSLLLLYAAGPVVKGHVLVNFVHVCIVCAQLAPKRYGSQLVWLLIAMT
jgi:hypothetical protein